VYRLITLPLAGAAGLEPCAVDGADEVAIVIICRCCLSVVLYVETSEGRRVPFLEVIECWRGFVRGERVEEEAWEWVDIC
jgi:hypothetical protein